MYNPIRYWWRCSSTTEKGYSIGFGCLVGGSILFGLLNTQNPSQSIDDKVQDQKGTRIEQLNYKVNLDLKCP